jgi:hypothetical protein
MMYAVPNFQSAFDHRTREVGRDEASALAQDEVREAAVTAGRIEDERTVRAGPGYRIQGSEPGEGAAQKTPLAAVHEPLIKASVSAFLIIGDARAVKWFWGQRIIL